MRRYVKILLLSLVLLPLVSTISPTYADTMSEQELEDWFLEDPFKDDTNLPLDSHADEVNEGQLTFIPPLEDKDVVSTDAVVSLTADSLDTGMVSLQQCYRNLDPVPEVDVVYRYKNMQQLRIVSSRNIADARVVGSSVQLKDVTKGAFVCIAADVQLLEKISQDAADLAANQAATQVARNYYGLSFGPYYRRFLDGYYPYHATVSINYPDKLLEFSAVSPSLRPHFELVRKPGELVLDTWFEGILQIDIRFSSTVRY